MSEYRTQSRDTSREIEEILFAAYREMPAWRKLEKVADLNRTCRQLALIGLRQRHPDATEDELRMRLAALRLGADLVRDLVGFDADS